MNRAYRATLALAVAVALAVGVAVVRADAPMGRFTSPQVGVVYDTQTQLTWQQDVDPNRETWGGADRYCAGLKLANGGWRLPSMKELQTIVDESVAQGNVATIDARAFGNAPADSFWSSSRLAGPAGSAWYVSFSSGSCYAYDLARPLRVRCVR
jgi:hypothetical protein